MLPFNIEDARNNKPVITRSGKEVRIICYDRLTNNKNCGPIIALVKGPKGVFESIITCDINGKQSDNIKELDLFIRE